MNASQQIVQVPFHDDVIEAVRAEDGKILVHFKQVCKSLGLNHTAQLQKMRDREWCEIVDLCTPDQRGRQQRLTMIDLESLPLWLATINPLNVRQETKAKLIRYQREAKAVLAAWFLGTEPPKPARERLDPGPMPQINPYVLEIHRRAKAIQEIEKQWFTAYKELGDVASAALLAAEDNHAVIDMPVCPVVTPAIETAAPEPVAEPTPPADDVTKLELEDDEHEYMPVWKFFKLANVRVDGQKPTQTARAKFSAEIKKLSMELGVPIKEEPSAKFGKVNLYRDDVLWAWKDMHDKREAEAAERRARREAERFASKPNPAFTQPRFNFLERNNGVAH